MTGGRSKWCDDTILCLAQGYRNILVESGMGLRKGRKIEVQRLMIHELWEGIEAIQHSVWERELQKHRQETYDLINYKLGTLTTSHQSRINFITEQIRKASNPKIRLMRDAELRNANMDFERRKSKLQETLDKSDIIVSKLAYGVLVVDSL